MIYSVYQYVVKHIHRACFAGNQIHQVYRTDPGLRGALTKTFERRSVISFERVSLPSRQTDTLYCVLCLFTMDLR